MARSFLFVESTHIDDAAKRRARSHVMQGKNRGRKINRRSRVPAPLVRCCTTPLEEYRGPLSPTEACVAPERSLGSALRSLALPVEVTADSAYAINHCEQCPTVIECPETDSCSCLPSLQLHRRENVSRASRHHDRRSEADVAAGIICRRSMYVMRQITLICCPC